MRKIISSGEMEKRRKRNATILSTFMLLILLISTAGYAFMSGTGSPEETPEYEEGKVINFGNQWGIIFGDRVFYFVNSPDPISEIPVDISLNKEFYSGKNLYLDVSNPTINAEITAVLGNYASKIQEACFESCPDRNVPEKDCTENLIVWRDSPENKVYQDQNCVFIEGDLGATEAFIYKVFGYI